jgi:precorrin-2/cobalt-factor-2 C20-methyltransferase
VTDTSHLPPPASVLPVLGTFYGIGVGPGDPELVTVKGAAMLARCPHVFVPKARLASESLALNIARRYLSGTATVNELVFPMTADENELDLRWRQAAAEVAQPLRHGTDTCFLTLGDPLLYSTYIYLLRALRAELPELNAVTAPGITSFCAAAALTGFTLGEGKEPLTVIPTADDLTAVREALRRGGTVVLMKIGERLPDVVTALKEARCLERAVLVSRAGQAEQQVVTDLRALRPEDSRIGYLSVILVRGHKDRGAGVEGRGEEAR